MPMNKICKSCGRHALWYEDPKDFLYREDILFCSLCCKEENECDCLDIRNHGFGAPEDGSQIMRK